MTANVSVLQNTDKMKAKKLIPMVQFILEIDWMTTKEFCDTYRVPLPFFTGDVKSSADQFLQVDAIKHKMFVEYAKFLAKDISIDILKNKLGFTDVETRGGYAKFSNGRFTITNDQYGFWLEPYDSVDGSRLSKLESLAGYGLSYNDR